MAKKVEGFPRSIPNVNEACWDADVSIRVDQNLFKTYKFLTARQPSGPISVFAIHV